MTLRRPGSTQQARQRQRNGLARSLTPRSGDDDLIDLAGNDYLGLCRDPRVTAAAAEAALRWGAGASASRLVTGTLPVHTELERALADRLGHGAALVFSTGYHANLSAVTSLTDRDTLLVSDAHVHASLVDACRLARHGRSRSSATTTSHRSQARLARTHAAAGAGPRRVGLLGARRRRPARRAGRSCASGTTRSLVVDEAHAHRGRGRRRSASSRDRASPAGPPSWSR